MARFLVRKLPFLFSLLIWFSLSGSDSFSGELVIEEEDPNATCSIFGYFKPKGETEGFELLSHMVRRRFPTQSEKDCHSQIKMYCHAIVEKKRLHPHNLTGFYRANKKASKRAFVITEFCDIRKKTD